MTNYFTCENLYDNITSIADPTGVRAFLITGEKEAALIDTCCGIGNLKGLVRTITDLPLSVICTHGHVDHAGGAYGFDKVYLNEEDFEVVKEHTTIARRMAFATACNVETEEKDYVPQKTDAYLPLKNGQVFDLGGITLECIQVKGHTQGMTAVLIKEPKILITGDSCNPFTYMFLPESASIKTLMASLSSLLTRSMEFDTVWVSHGEAFVPKTIINTVLDTCETILKDKDDKVPFESMGRKAFIAARMDENGRIDKKIGNVVYSPDKL